MGEYALLINNEFKEIRMYEDKPEDIPHKGVEWLPVSHTQEVDFPTGRDADNIWVVYLPAERRKIDKTVIMERLTDEQLEAAINLMSIRQKERWRMPGYPSVYVDDPEVIGMLQAVGANPEEVLA